MRTQLASPATVAASALAGCIADSRRLQGHWTMDDWTRIEGVAAPLLRPNNNTDIIIPSREISSPERTSYADKLFAPWRYRGPDRSKNPDSCSTASPSDRRRS